MQDFLNESFTFELEQKQRQQPISPKRNVLNFQMNTPVVKKEETELDKIKKENFSLKIKLNQLQEVLEANGLLKDGKTELFSSKYQRNSSHDNNIKYNNSINETTEKSTRPPSANISLVKESANKTSRNQTPTPDQNSFDISFYSQSQQPQVNLRKDYENVQLELAECKSQLIQQNSLLSQKMVEIQHLRQQNESLQHSIAPHPQSTSNSNLLYSLSSSNPNLLVNSDFEQGIQLLQQQVSEYKLQVIEKQATIESLQLSFQQASQSADNSLSIQKASLNQQIHSLNLQISKLKQDVNEKDFELRKVYKEIEKVKRDKLEAEVEGQIGRGEYEKEVDEYRHKLSDLEREMKSMSEALLEKDQQLLLKTKHNEQLNKQLESKQSILTSTERETIRARNQMEQHFKQIQSELSFCNQLVETKDSELNLLKEQLQRQKDTLIQMESNWSNQSSQMQEQSKKIRTEMDKQISYFKSKYESTKELLDEKEKQVSDLTKNMDMMHIGFEERLSRLQKEKDLLLEDLNTVRSENLKLKEETLKLEDRISAADLDTKDLISSSERKNLIFEEIQSKLKRSETDNETLTSLLKSKERDLREKVIRIQELEDILENTEHSAVESKQIQQVIEERFSSQMKDRDTLLVKLRNIADEFINTNNLGFQLSDFLEVESPSQNFFAFSESLLEKLTCISHFPSFVESKVKRAESRMEEGFKALHLKFERKIAHLEKFERMVKDAVEVQKRLRENLQAKQEQLLECKQEIERLRHECSIKQHEITTLQSESLIAISAEKGYTIEALAKVEELERRMKERDKNIMELRKRSVELEDGISRQKGATSHRVQELVEQVRLLKQELEISQRQAAQMEKLLRKQSETDTMIKKSSMQSLLETSEAALDNLKIRLKDESEHYEKLLEKERNYSNNVEMELAKLRNDNVHLKRKIEKREAMIEMALGKLELLNGITETNAIVQFKDDFKKMMGKSAGNNIDGASVKQQSGMDFINQTSSSLRSSRGYTMQTNTENDDRSSSSKQVRQSSYFSSQQSYDGRK